MIIDDIDIVREDSIELEYNEYIKIAQILLSEEEYDELMKRLNNDQIL